jgi:GTP-binding protein
VPLHPAAPEFALLGRSNVGKSSLLNALVGRRGTARVSATPGKTALLNVYRSPSFYLLDLPGYGFARASQAVRAQHRRLIDAVVAHRATLTGVVWLLDARHAPSADDRAMRRQLGNADRNVLAVLTKADKVPRRDWGDLVADRAADLALTADQVQLVSARTGFGIPGLAATLLATAGDAP